MQVLANKLVEKVLRTLTCGGGKEKPRGNYQIKNEVLRSFVGTDSSGSPRYEPCTASITSKSCLARSSGQVK